MAQSLIIPRTAVVRGSRPEAELPWAVVFWVAAGMTILGLLDVMFMWVPFRIGEIAWRFRIIAATVDALPLTTIGLTAWLVASVRRAAYRGLICIALVSSTVFALLLLLGVWFVASALQMQEAVGRNVPPPIEVARIALFTIIYLAVYSTITVSAAGRMLGRSEYNSPD